MARAGAPRVALVIPTLNEAEAIAGTLAEIPIGVVDLVVVADGGSADGTQEIAAAAGATVLASGRGFGRACLEGVCEARDADIIAFMDADGADDPAFLPALLKPLADGKSRLRHRVPHPWRARAGRHGLASGGGGARGGLRHPRALRRRLFGHVHLPRHPPRRAGRPRHAGTHLRLEHRDADARRPRLGSPSSKFPSPTAAAGAASPRSPATSPPP